MANAGSPEFDAARHELLRITLDKNIIYKAQLEVCHDKFGENCHVPYVKPEDWLRLQRRHQSTEDPEIRRTIYKAACKQHNMSCNVQKHGLYWVPPNDRRIRRERKVANTDVGFQDGKFFDFARLVKDNPEIVNKIISYTMVRHSVISVIYRNDGHDVNPPVQGGLDPKTVHYGSRACAINSAPLQRDVMAPMFVCRDWYEMFGTAFYFLNAFSFESLGEFQIFCERTSSQCLKRIITLMITWIGSNMAASNPRRKGSSYCPSRHGMAQLNELINLRTFEIRIDETSNDRVRRKHEGKSKKKPLQKSTKNHENYTGSRCFRTMRGLDSITQLRGVKCLEIFDYNRKYPKTTIRDRTFLEDTRRQVYSPKSSADKAKANLKTLKPLWERKGADEWVMSEQVRKIVHGIFDMLSDDANDERERNAGDGLDDDNNGGGGDGQNPGGDNNRNPDDDDSDEDDDNAPEQGGNAFNATPVVSEARKFAEDGGENGGNEGDIDEMDGLEPNQGSEWGDGSAESSAIDLSHLSDMEDPDTVFPSIEQDEEKQEVKSEDPTGAEGTDAMENFPVFEGHATPQRGARSPFEPLSPRQGYTPQSYLFVRQSPSSRRSQSSFAFGYLGSPSSERKRSTEDGDDDTDAPPSLRRRLAVLAVDEDKMEE